MITFSKILGLLRSRLRSKHQKRSSFHSVRTHKRSTFHSFSSSRASSLPSSLAVSPLPGRPLDVVIHNLHADAWGTARAARPIATETLLAHMLAVVARRHIHLHSVAATAFSITLVIDDALDMMAADEGTASAASAGTQASTYSNTPSEKSGSTAANKLTDTPKQGFRSLVSELVNAVDGVDLREKDFICEENRRNRILGQRRRHEW
ncbi:hypothetical protein F503_06954 [Ophiostoma piceae UAMH 11346]|uniref:Uncharacterized protein n=1 Tax=Ophiostoma piceae (strain UAMH 11346) TaxID=1262450 RepID=S3CRE2_OPHP1|nr:hypothetical protein F503_06954 [Ophiostoma piceae UAMH 11346]